MANVQIPRELFDKLCDYFLSDDVCYYDDIVHALSDKLESMRNRELFSQYKQSIGSHREVLRQSYLDSKGISSDFRTDSEAHDI